MLTFECYAKYGNRWSYKGTKQEDTPRLAAFAMQYIHNRSVWRIRPEGSRDKFLVIRISTPPSWGGA